MKKTYKIEVDCANCANLMEEAARKTEGVQAATVNFMTQKLIVEFADGQEPKAVMQKVLAACKKVEPDCKAACPPLRAADSRPGCVPNFERRNPCRSLL